MPSAQQLYTELTTQLRRYLEQEYRPGSRLPVSRDNYNRFVAEAKTRRYREEEPKKPTQVPVRATAKRPQPRPAPLAPPSAATKISAPPAQAQPQQEPQQKQEPPTSQSLSVALSKPSDVREQEFSSLRTHLQQHLPAMEYVETIPDDTTARRIRFQWLQDRMAIAIIAAGVPDDELLFLEKMAKGITSRLAPAYVVTEYHSTVFGGWQGLLAGSALRALVVPQIALAAGSSLAAGLASDGTLYGQPATVIAVSDLINNAANKRALWQHLVALIEEKTP